MAAVALTDSRPMNQVSVRPSTAWIVLLSTSGAASVSTARMSICLWPVASRRSAGSGRMVLVFCFMAAGRDQALRGVLPRWRRFGRAV